MFHLVTFIQIFKVDFKLLFFPKRRDTCLLNFFLSKPSFFYPRNITCSSSLICFSFLHLNSMREMFSVSDKVLQKNEPSPFAAWHCLAYIQLQEYKSFYPSASKGDLNPLSHWADTGICLHAVIGKIWRTHFNRSLTRSPILMLIECFFQDIFSMLFFSACPICILLRAGRWQELMPVCINPNFILA